MFGLVAPVFEPTDSNLVDFTGDLTRLPDQRTARYVHFVLVETSGACRSSELSGQG
jgi:hypothetical protein